MSTEPPRRGRHHVLIYKAQIRARGLAYRLLNGELQAESFLSILKAAKAAKVSETRQEKPSTRLAENQVTWPSSNYYTADGSCQIFFYQVSFISAIDL